MLNPISANSANLSFANVGDVAFTIILPNEHFSFAQYDLIMFSGSVFSKNPIHCPFISLRRIRSLYYAESAYFIIDGVCRVFLRWVYKAIIRYFVAVR